MPRYPVVVVETTPDEADAMVGRLTLLGAEGIEERDATTLARGGAQGVTLVASFPTHELAEQAVQALGPAARIEEIVGDAWRDAWKEHWRATRLGTRVVVVPSWLSYQPEPGDVVMRLDPGRAFGTGQHPSTYLAAAALDRCIDEGARDAVLDVGCGSGILSFVALMLGAPRAIACDTDPDAVAAARENARSLGLEDRIDLRVGGVEVIPETSLLVVANIEAAVLVPLASAIAARVAPGGTLILSGILAEQREMVTRAYEATGLELARCEARHGWIAPEFTRGT
jgi:ribosomal protein L11 methyltransferase